MRRFALTVVILGACNSGVQPTTTSSAAPQPAVIAPVAADPIAKGIPHGSQIIGVAATDDGDAAITFDNLFGVRLWPSLDGTRPPIPLTVEAPRHVSLAHAGRDLLAVITSDANSVRVMQLGHDGRIRSNVTLPGEYLQAVAIDGGVLVRTPDHAIERYDTAGELRGRVVTEPGTQVATIVTRNGHSAALIRDGKLGTSRTVRMLTIDDGLSWGVTRTLQSVVNAELVALSPSGSRIAFGNMQHQLEVWEVEPFQRKLEGYAAQVNDPDSALGFIDDAHVAVNTNGTMQLWSLLVPQPKQADIDPWSVEPHPAASLPQPREQTHLIDGFAVANGKVITGFGVALAISTLEKVQYLGYKTLPVGTISAVDDQFAMTMAPGRFIWLDDKLVVHRDDDLEVPTNSAPASMYAVPLDAEHVISETLVDSKYEFTLVDLTTKAKTPIGTFREVDRMQYDESSRLFGIKEGRKLHRFAYDAGAMTALPDLRVKGQVTSYTLFDPAKANGITAAVVGWDNDNASYEALTIYRDKGKSTRIYPFTGAVTSASPDATLYVTEAGQVRIYRGGQKKPASIKLADSIYSAVTNDGARIAYTTANELVVADATGAPTWRQPQWGSSQLMFSSDKSKLLVRGIGGLAVYDASTGARIARECGWNFGLYDEAVESNAAGAQPMCEDPMLQ